MYGVGIDRAHDSVWSVTTLAFDSFGFGAGLGFLVLGVAGLGAVEIGAILVHVADEYWSLRRLENKLS